MKTLISEYRTDSGAYTVEIYRTETGWCVENTVDPSREFPTEHSAEAFADGWIANQNYLDTASDTVECPPVKLTMRR